MIEKVFFREIPLKILRTLKTRKVYLTELNRKINGTYANTSKVVNMLEKIEILKTEIVGRKRIIKLTEKGIQLKQNINNILKNDIKQNILKTE